MPHAQNKRGGHQSATATELRAVAADHHAQAEQLATPCKREPVYFFLADFFLMVFLAAGFFAGDFFLAAAGFFLAGDFLAAAGFLAGDFFLAAAGFLAMVFLTAGFLAFLAAAGFCNKGHGGPTSAQADVARGRCPVARMHKGGRRIVRGWAG